jgi:hypothetical protein
LLTPTLTSGFHRQRPTLLGWRSQNRCLPGYERSSLSNISAIMHTSPPSPNHPLNAKTVIE